MASKLKPLPGYVLIEPLDDEETTASGLVMPEKAKEKPVKGMVLAVGRVNVPDGIGIPINSLTEYHAFNTPIDRGDMVIFHRWAGQDVKEGQNEYRLVKFGDLMAVYV